MADGIPNNINCLMITLKNKKRSYGKELIFVTLERAIFIRQENFKYPTLIKNLSLECHGMIFALKFKVEVSMI